MKYALPNAKRAAGSHPKTRKPLTNQRLRRTERVLRSDTSVLRIPMLALLGVLLAALATLVYSYLLTALAIPTPEAVANLIPAAEVYFVAILVCVGLVLFDAKGVLSERITAIGSRGVAPLSPSWIIPHVLSVRRYRRIFVATTLLYGAFYAVITSMVVYQPTVDFVQAYGAPIPSVQVTPVPATPLFTPVVTVYVANHLGLLLIPLTVLLLVTTSLLVGLNFALAGFAFDSRAKGTGRGWVGGIGAVVGLFTGCPTCAGLFFANFLGGAGAVSFATLLGCYQPAFILLSIPVLLAAPYLTSRSLSKVFREGCVLLQTTA